jgi:hypothetical protein
VHSPDSPREAEVRQLQQAVAADEEVRGLYVAVRKALLVAERNGGEQLGRVLVGAGFRQGPRGLQRPLEVAVRQFEDEVHALRAVWPRPRGGHAQQFHNVGVAAQRLQGAHFADAVRAGVVVQQLECHALLGRRRAAVQRAEHRAVHPLAHLE